MHMQMHHLHVGNEVHSPTYKEWLDMKAPYAGPTTEVKDVTMHVLESPCEDPKYLVPILIMGGFILNCGLKVMVCKHGYSLCSTLFFQVLIHVYILRVIGYHYVFGYGLLGSFLFQNFMQDIGFPSKLVQRHLK